MYDSYMKDIPISTARETLAEVIETIHRTSEPVGLTRRGRRVAVLVDAAVFDRLTQDAEDALDRAAAELAREEEARIPWTDIKADLGLD